MGAMQAIAPEHPTDGRAGKRAPWGIPRAGEVIAGGKYRIEEVLGVGGVGAVLGATHLQLGQPVAIKLLLPEADRDPEAVPRFLSEARATARLDSEHVVRILDVDTLEGGVPYIVMERLQGLDLGEVAARGWPLPVPEALDYVLQACLGVAEAHARGIVHRDLKPHNLFVTCRRDGTPLVKVVDFGLVKAVGGERLAHVRTTTASIMGTPHYMSPEQIRSSRSVDRRSDIWSLGVVLYEILAGTRPFDGESASEICAQVAADPPIPLRASRPDIPGEVEAVVLRCLEKDVQRRFQTVAEFASALLPFAPRQGSRLTGQRILDLCGATDAPASPVLAPAPEHDDAATAVDRPQRRKRVPFTAAAAVLLIALAAALWRTRPARQAPPPAPVVAAAQAGPPAPAPSADGSAASPPWPPPVAPARPTARARHRRSLRQEPDIRLER
jgi:eukaryotic-like serine/threonine-protein kinase